MTRASSGLRTAFEASAAGVTNRKEIAGDVWPTVHPATAVAKAGKSVAANGDLNPPWPLLDLILEANPDPVLDYIGQLCGVRWEPLPTDPSVALRTILETQSALREQMDTLADQVADLRRMRKVEPRREQETTTG